MRPPVRLPSHVGMQRALGFSTLHTWNGKSHCPFNSPSRGPSNARPTRTVRALGFSTLQSRESTGHFLLLYQNVSASMSACKEHWAFRLCMPKIALGIFYYYTKMCMCGIIELGLCFFEFLEHASQVYCSIARRSILGRNYTIQQRCFFERACTPRCILRRARRYAAFAALILEARPSVSCYRNSRVYLEV